MILADATAASAGLGVGEIGRVFVATIVVVAIILGCAWVLRHTGKLTHVGNQHLRVTAARALGGKNKLVVVEFEGVQLLLGAGQSGVNVLHKAPVPKVTAPLRDGEPGEHAPGRVQDAGTFSTRFAAALKQNLGLRH